MVQEQPGTKTAVNTSSLLVSDSDDRKIELLDEATLNFISIIGILILKNVQWAPMRKR